MNELLQAYGPYAFAAIFSIGPVVGLVAAGKFYGAHPEPDHAKPKGFGNPIVGLRKLKDELWPPIVVEK